MSQIKNADTKPELIFRKHVWTEGMRGYRTKSKITGKPDLFFSKKKIAVFIDGCFWHKCSKCYIRPKSNLKYWDKKIGQNVTRDKTNTWLLQNQGIRVIRIWEHEVIEKPKKALARLKKTYEKVL